MLSAAWLRVGCVASFMLLAAGCGGGAGVPPSSLDDFYRRLNAWACNWDVACEYMPDVATCLATRQDRPDVATQQAGVDSGKVVYNAAKAGACLDDLERAYAGCKLIPFVRTAGTEETCAEFLVGTVAVGGGCFLTEECASRSCQQADPACVRLRQCCPGTCVARPEPTPVGGDCSAAQTCAPGSYCVVRPGGTSHTCEVPSTTRGTPCTQTLQCASPLYCDLDLTTVMPGTCEPFGATGARCNPDVFSCEDGRDYCDPTTLTCTRRRGIGATCDPEQQNCLVLAQCVGTTCVARSAVGGACNPTDPSCLIGLECATQTNTCAFPAADDGPCL